jgi:hypothetical protein
MLNEYRWQLSENRLFSVWYEAFSAICPVTVCAAAGLSPDCKSDFSEIGHLWPILLKPKSPLRLCARSTKLHAWNQPTIPAPHATLRLRDAIHVSPQ